MSSTNRGSKKEPNEFYPTPDYAIDLLLDKLNLNLVDSFLEPCKGDGAIFNKINCPEKYYCEIREGKDYLKEEFANIDLIITNPPFTLAEPFISKSLREATTVCYLLRLNFFGGQKRKNWWNSIDKPNHLFILSKRPCFINGKSDSCEYGWFVWDQIGMVKQGNENPTQIEIL